MNKTNHKNFRDGHRVEKTHLRQQNIRLARSAARRIVENFNRKNQPSFGIYLQKGNIQLDHHNLHAKTPCAYGWRSCGAES
jgi:hypothetical protein